MAVTGWTVVFVLAGALAGVGARRLAARVRRGARTDPPWCELAVGVVWGVTGGSWAVGALPGRWLAVLLALGWLGAALAAVDLTSRRLPDALTVPALPVAVLLVAPLGGGPVLRGVAGAAVAAGAHAAVRCCAPGAVGGGDVKLAAPLGVVLAAASWAALPLAAALAAVLTAVVAAAGLAAGRLRSGDPVPHGPSMLLAAWLVAFASAAGAG